MAEIYDTYVLRKHWYRGLMRIGEALAKAYGVEKYVVAGTSNGVFVAASDREGFLGVGENLFRLDRSSGFKIITVDVLTADTEGTKKAVLQVCSDMGLRQVA